MSSQVDDALRSLKVEPPARLRAEGRAAMVRLSEQQFSNEKKRIAERRKRLDPVYQELEAVLKKSPEFAGVVSAIDARDNKHRQAGPPAASRHPFAPTRPLVRHGSIHIVDSLPFYSDTWLGQEGSSNSSSLTADGTTGDMSFSLSPGLSSSGQMSCWAALGATVAIPSSTFIIDFTANPSVSWWYNEKSEWWRQAAGNMWVGLYVGLFNSDGTFLASAVDTQNSVVSFNDYNLADDNSNSGSNSAMPLSAGIILDLPFADGGLPWAAEGGFLQYWCWIGGSCNSDGSNSQSEADIQMNANCANLIVDIFEF
jgi:hypothetical protein